MFRRTTVVWLLSFVALSFCCCCFCQTQALLADVLQRTKQQESSRRSIHKPRRSNGRCSLRVKHPRGGFDGATTEDYWRTTLHRVEKRKVGLKGTPPPPVYSFATEKARTKKRHTHPKRKAPSSNATRTANLGNPPENRREPEKSFIGQLGNVVYLPPFSVFYRITGVIHCVHYQASFSSSVGREP